MTRALSLLAVIAVVLSTLPLVTGCPGGGGTRELTVDQQIKQIMSSTTDPATQARKLIEIAKIQAANKDRTGTRRTLDIVFKACESINTAADKAKAFAELAEMEVAIKRNPAARSAQDRAFKALQEVVEPSEKVACLMRIAKSQSVVKSTTGEIDSAKVDQLIQQAEGLLEQISGAELKVKLLCDLAATFSAMGKTDDVSRLLDKGQSAIDASKDERQRAEILGQLGAAWATNGQADRAKELFTQATTACTKLAGDDRNQGYAMIELAERMLAAGFPTEASALAVAGEEVANRIPEASMKYPLKKRAQAIINAAASQ